ncbi:MAG: hypothetical protein NTV92_08805, partial [Candidatus Bipolaricaulota bacterium]|nr:hypothetical protein [Candidatus Bipolaricaulota bacterium]
MAIEKRLQLALSKKEKAERLIAALEGLRGEGRVSQEEHARLKQEYTRYLIEATEEVNRLRADIERQLAEHERRLETLAVELREVAMRTQDGGAAGRDRGADRLRAEESRVKAMAGDLRRLRAAEASAQAGGYVDVQLGAPRSAGAGLSGFPPSGRAISLSPFLGIARTASELTTPSFRVVAPIASLTMFISLFLRWVGGHYGYYGYGFSISGTASGGTTAMGILAAIFSTIAWALAHSKLRGG